MADGDGTSRLTHESFAAIANDHRMEILRVLWFHGPLSFSDCYDLVSVDDTGQFTYHLNKLLDHFVVKSGDEYKLLHPGKEIVMTILSHVGADDPLRSPISLDADCSSCGSPIQAVSSAGWVHIDCGSCEKVYSSFPFPLAGLRDRSPDEFLPVYDRWIRRTYALVHAGICPNCSSRMTSEAVLDAEPEPGLPVVFDHRCGHCRLEIFTPPGTGLLEQPAVVSFYHRHDRDLLDIPHWRLEWLFDGRCIDVVADDPIEYVIDIVLDHHRLRATLEETGSCIGTELETVSTDGGPT